MDIFFRIKDGNCDKLLERWNRYKSAYKRGDEGEASMMFTDPVINEMFNCFYKGRVSAAQRAVCSKQYTP